MSPALFRLLPSLRLFSIESLPSLQPLKVTKFLRPLAITPSAAVQKQRKVIINKFTPYGKLQLKHKTHYLASLDRHCRIFDLAAVYRSRAQPRAQLQPRFQQPKTLAIKRKNKRLTLDILSKLKPVRKAKIEKKARRARVRQTKRKLTSHFETALSTEVSISWSIAWPLLQPVCSSPSTEVEMSDSVDSCCSSSSDSSGECSVLSISGHLESPIIYKGRGGKLRGADSKFATDDFDPSEAKVYAVDGSRQNAESIEAHLEIEQEVTRASSTETFDLPLAQGWTPDTFAGRFAMEISANRRQVAQEHAARQRGVVQKAGIDQSHPTRKALAAPAGARKAVPMRLVALS